MDVDIDDAIADRAGHALFALATLNEGARTASLGLSTALSIASAFLPGSGLGEAFSSINVTESSENLVSKLRHPSSGDHHHGNQSTKR